MCGRFTLAAEAAELQLEFEDAQFPLQFAPRYNVAPSQPVLALLRSAPKAADYLKWGLVPSWAKDPAIGNRLINARAETLGEKPAFRSPYKYKRCLVLADGFFEWKSVPGARVKVPYYIQLDDGRPFGFAGIWSEWHAADGSEMRSCAIVTTTPNDMMARIHNRMPVILARQDRELWLDASPREPGELDHLLRPFPAEAMRAIQVSTAVNNPDNDGVECIRPV